MATDWDTAVIIEKAKKPPHCTSTQMERRLHTSTACRPRKSLHPWLWCKCRVPGLLKVERLSQRLCNWPNLRGQFNYFHLLLECSHCRSTRPLMSDATRDFIICQRHTSLGILPQKDSYCPCTQRQRRSGKPSPNYSCPGFRALKQNTGTISKQNGGTISKHNGGTILSTHHTRSRSQNTNDTGNCSLLHSGETKPHRRLERSLL